MNYEWKTLKKILEIKINKALKDTVAPAVKETMREAVIEDVYGAGTPKFYKRRMGTQWDSESLTNTGNMPDKVHKGTLEVTNVAEANEHMVKDFFRGKDFKEFPLAKNIAEGYGSMDKWYNVPRDFFELTRIKLDTEKIAVDELANGLRKQGLEVY